MKWIVVALAVLALAGCAADPMNSPAQVKADEAKYGGAPSSSIPADEQAALDDVAPACSETPDKLDAEAAKAVELLAEKGIHDETTVTVLRHLRDSIPVGVPVMNCTTVLGPYISMRTGGS